LKTQQNTNTYYMI